MMNQSYSSSDSGEYDNYQIPKPDSSMLPEERNNQKKRQKKCGVACEEGGGMTKIPELWVLRHFDWYTHDAKNGYQPTALAPQEAVEALRNINQENIRIYGKL